MTPILQTISGTELAFSLRDDFFFWHLFVASLFRKSREKIKPDPQGTN
jgi:hypothetical protein